MTTCALFPVLALLAAVFCSYMTFAVGVAAEVIALLLVCSSLDRFGRHTVIAFGQLLGGGACVACALVNNGITQAVLAGVGKFGCSGTMHVLIICLRHSCVRRCCLLHGW